VEQSQLVANSKPTRSGEEGKEDKAQKDGRICFLPGNHERNEGVNDLVRKTCWHQLRRELVALPRIDLIILILVEEDDPRISVTKVFPQCFHDSVGIENLEQTGERNLDFAKTMAKCSERHVCKAPSSKAYTESNFSTEWIYHWMKAIAVAVVDEDIERGLSKERKMIQRLATQTTFAHANGTNAPQDSMGLLLVCVPMYKIPFCGMPN